MRSLILLSVLQHLPDITGTIKGTMISNVECFQQNVKLETLGEFDFVFVLESESKYLNIDELVELLFFFDTCSLATRLNVFYRNVSIKIGLLKRTYFKKTIV